MILLPLKEEHLLDIIQLSNTEFGIGYLSIDYLKSHINSDKHIAYIIIKNKQIAGFTLIDILTPLELKNYVLKNSNWFYDYFKEFNLIAVRKQTIISKDFQNQGLGFKLIKQSIAKIKSNVTLSIVWDKGENTYLRNVLLKNNFSEIKSIPNYWRNDSLFKNYNCSSCGKPPCKCGVIVFVRK